VEIDVGQRGGGNEKTLRAKVLGGSQNVCDFTSSLAVFYVEQVALNRHVTPPKRLVNIKQDNGAGVKGKIERGSIARNEGKQIPHYADSIRNDKLEHYQCFSACGKAGLRSCLRRKSGGKPPHSRRLGRVRHKVVLFC